MRVPDQDSPWSAGRILRSLDPVGDAFGPGHARTVGAAVEVTVGLHAVADDLHATVLAGGGEGVNGALEAVEGARLTTGHANLEGLVVVVAVYLALGHDPTPLSHLLLLEIVPATEGSQSEARFFNAINPVNTLEEVAAETVH